jgi:flagellar biosynthesis/type III secretory pathway protein FliH
MRRHATRTLRVVFQRTVLIAVAVIIGAVLGTLFSTRAYYGEQRHENVALKDRNTALVAHAAEAEARANESADQLAQTEEVLSSTKSSLTVARHTAVVNRGQVAKLTSKLRVARRRSAHAYGAGKAAGYQHGKDEGYSTGYDVGYDEGLADGSGIVELGRVEHERARERIRQRMTPATELQNRPRRSELHGVAFGGVHQGLQRRDRIAH